jgi:ankyrin repeat protein
VCPWLSHETLPQISLLWLTVTGALTAASSLGHIETVELLIREGADIDIESFAPKLYTPVMAAVSAGHANVVRALVDHDADLMIPDGHDHTVLEIAMMKSHNDIVAILLEVLGGADYPQESVALEIATALSETSIRMIMVRAGLIYSQIDSTNPTPQYLRSIQIVLDEGGELVKTRAMSNMMCVALYDGELDVVLRLLVNGCNPNEYLASGQTPLHLAVSQNNVQLVEILLKGGADPALQVQGPDSELTPLYQALAALDSDLNRDTSIVDRLLDSRRCKLMAGNHERSNALDYVLSHYDDWDHGVAEIMTFRMLQSVDDIQNDQSNNGSTMMHVAVWHSRTDLIDILLSRGANIDAKDLQGRTPFLLECQRGKRLLRFLLSKGADPHTRNHEAQSALHAAAEVGNIAVIDFLLNIGLPINTSDHANHTPLTWAVISNQEPAALHLLSRGATIPTHALHHGRTVLHVACNLGMKVLTSLLLSTPGLDINAADHMGRTPFSLACKNGSAEVIQAQQRGRHPAPRRAALVQRPRCATPH